MLICSFLLYWMFISCYTECSTPSIWESCNHCLLQFPFPFYVVQYHRSEVCQFLQLGTRIYYPYILIRRWTDINCKWLQSVWFNCKLIKHISAMQKELIQYFLICLSRIVIATHMFQNCIFVQLSKHLTGMLLWCSGYGSVFQIALKKMIVVISYKCYMHLKFIFVCVY